MREIVNSTEAEQRIKAEEPFRIASGAWHGDTGGAVSYGSLPEKYRVDAALSAYVVYSYGTPIGWVRHDGSKVVPDVGYSLSTGQHQYGTLHAWGIDRFPARGRTTVPSGGGPRRGGIDGPS